MDALEQNNRRFLVATVIMLVITFVVIIVGMILYPYSAFWNPNAGPIPGFINSPAGNIVVIILFGVLACNVGFYFNNVTRLERERNYLLVESPQANARQPRVTQSLRESGAIEPPKPPKPPKQPKR